MRWLVLLVAGCCGDTAPVWDALAPVEMAEDERVEISLAGVVTGRGLTFSVEADSGVLATVVDDVLVVVAEQGFSGASRMALTATDACDNSSTAEVDVVVGGVVAGECGAALSYAGRGDPDAVFVAGTFNDWDPTATPLVRVGDRWEITLELGPGAWPYKLVEVTYGDAGATTWACDPEAEFVQCDEGYVWDPSCPLGGGGCNSLLVVEDCAGPTLEVASLAIDRVGNGISIDVAAGGTIESGTITLDGSVVQSWAGAGSSYSVAGLSEGRHTLRVEAMAPGGAEAKALYVPFWLDDRSWETGLLYYVFVDRFSDGDATLNFAEGTNATATDYLGGDWQGVIDRLDYLDSLGVTVLWLTAPQENAGGAWDGLCGATYSGYHGYWPSGAFESEEHFGDSATLHDLVDAAHARGMRVLTDWVANHVHTDHPYYLEHPEWFTDLAECGDANNWNDIPETCWFASYLPDIRYYEPEPLVRMVDDAMAWVTEYELDGYRVDAVKHMPHAVFYNLASRVRSEVEHSAAGGDEPFYTVGETYSGDRGLIASYVNTRELDGQFDFPTYWAIVAALGRNEIGLSDGEGSLADTFADSEAAFAGNLMSTFLGNHDVARFLPQATGEIGSLYGDSPCGNDGALRTPDTGTEDPTPYARLRLAWTFLLTSEGLPLVYYGDELGLPGFNDPDNRQMMRFSELSANEAATLAHVQALGTARREHPAFAIGTRTTWWEGEADTYAYARVYEGDQVLVVLNRGAERTFTNGLAFAGLTADRWRDVLTGDTFVAEGDSLSVAVPALASRVLVPE